MKIIVVLALFVLAAAEEYYVTKNDNLDVDALFTDLDKVRSFMDCYLDKGPCSDLATSYKKILPEAISQACRKCNSAQKHIFWKFMKGIKAKLPEELESFKQKYDPENKYFVALEAEISKY